LGAFAFIFTRAFVSLRTFRFGRRFIPGAGRSSFSRFSSPTFFAFSSAGLFLFAGALCSASLLSFTRRRSSTLGARPSFALLFVCCFGRIVRGAKERQGRLEIIPKVVVC